MGWCFREQYIGTPRHWPNSINSTGELDMFLLITHSYDLSPVSIQTQSLALRALRKRKPQETQALALASSQLQDKA